MVELAPTRHDRSATPWVIALSVATLLAPLLARQTPGGIADPAASRHRPPATVLTAIELADGTTLLADHVTPLPDGGVEVLHAGVQRRLGKEALAPETPKPQMYLLGTDRLGRDLLARLLHGWRNSLGIAGLAALACLLAGALIGLVAAYSGGMIDRWTMRLVDVSMALPKLFVLLAIAATQDPGPLLLVLLLAAVSWMSVARLVRARALALRGAEFTEAARASGCSAGRILFHHYLPHLRPLLVTLGLLQFSSLILLEAALSFLGAGLAPPTPSLGGLVADAALRGSTSWWMVLFPGLAIALASLTVRWIASRSGDSAFS